MSVPYPSTPISTAEIQAIIDIARQTSDNFYAPLQPIRKPEALTEGRIIELTRSTYEKDPAAHKARLNSGVMQSRNAIGAPATESCMAITHIFEVVSLNARSFRHALLQ